MFSELINAIAYRNPDHIFPVVLLLLITLFVIYYLKGRTWAVVYVALIPFVNWTFGFADQVMQPVPFVKDAMFNPITIVTGLILVVRDFAQREMGHRILLVMAMAIGWSFYYAFPPIAIASAVAFAVSESVDWSLFTFTRLRLSTRILLSSALAAPIDTTVFLIGANITSPGQLSFWNVFFSIVGKMVGALIIFWALRLRENAGDPSLARKV
ncbi:MAG: hypothetical protein AAF583_15705 [Pseudomonadota bacterium]